jgi:3-methyladenine DNA glycosylase Tag
MHSTTSFAEIRARAERRKGGADTLARLLPSPPDRAALAALPDDRILAEMTKRVFSAGFVWSVIEAKWAGFEAAFLGFDPIELSFQPDDFWEALTGDARIVRNGQKIFSIRANAHFVRDTSSDHGGFGKFLAEWPADDQVGLLEYLAKHGSRLGGATGQYLLRFLGRDGYTTSSDVVLALRDAGLDVAPNPTSKRDRAKMQEQFNIWAAETGLPYMHLSRICAMSIGENYAPERLMAMGQGQEGDSE